jgi:hypothetical protein
LEDYLARPYFVVEPFTAGTGESVPPDELDARVSGLLLGQQGDALGVEELRG